MANTKDAAMMPDSARIVLATIQEWGFDDVEYRDDAPLIEQDKHLQGRAKDYLAPRAEIKRYADNMRRGDHFPPDVRTKDGYLIDGCTRNLAGKEAGLTYHPALIVNVSYVGASEPTQIRLRALGFALNHVHGTSLDDAGTKEGVETLLRNPNLEAPRIARLYRISVTTVYRIIAEKTVKDRAKAAYVNISNVPQPTLRALGQASWLHDAPFAALAKLTQDAQLSERPFKVLLRELRKANDDNKQLIIIAAERRVRADDIADIALTGKKNAKKKTWPEQVCSSLGILKRDLRSLVETDPSKAERYLDVIKEAESRLGGLRGLQEKNNGGIAKKAKHAA